MASSDRALDGALDLMRRLPPSQISKNLIHILDLNPSLTEDLLALVDQPLKVRKCPVTSKEYLLCDYNRDGDSYRSPFSNSYDPPLDDGGMKPTVRLRKLEERANEAFSVYRELYYEGGVSSVYFWDLDDGFACVVLIKKAVERMSWDSIHVVEVKDHGRSAVYKITSTIMLFLLEGSTFDLSGSLTRQEEKEMTLDDHVSNIGRLVEDLEFRMRNSLQEVYFGKTKQVIGELRHYQAASELNAQAMLQKEILGKLQARQQQS